MNESNDRRSAALNTICGRIGEQFRAELERNSGADLLEALVAAIRPIALAPKPRTIAADNPLRKQLCSSLLPHELERLGPGRGTADQIDAIRMLRQRFGFGLRTAKDVTDVVSGREERFQFSETAAELTGRGVLTERDAVDIALMRREDPDPLRTALRQSRI